MAAKGLVMQSARVVAIGFGVCFLCAQCAFALDPALDVSQYSHTAWKIRDGFIRGTILSMAQTPDGYLWLGTEFGLVRFDGVQAIPWQPPGDQQLPSNYIHDLFVSRDGALWIGTRKGLASWKNGRLTKYPETTGSRVHSLLQDAEGTIWFGLEEPGRLCAVRGVQTQCYGAGKFGFAVLAIYEDHKGNLWASAQTGLWRWKPGPPERYTMPDRQAVAAALIEGNNGSLVMATSVSGPLLGPLSSAVAGLKQLVAGKINGYELPGIGGQFKPTCLLRGRDGSLWIGTLHGLLHLHQGRVDRFSAVDGLSSDFVTGIFEDREGDVWVSTQTGLDQFHDFAVPTISVNQGLSNSVVFVLESTPDGSIWIATADGLNRWQAGHVTVYGEQGPATENSAVTRIANSGLRGAVYSLGQDNRGRLWAGSREGVFYFDGGRFVRISGVPGGNILAIAGDRDGNVWISEDDALFYSTADGSVQRIPWDRLAMTGPVFALLPDQLHGGLWVGSYDGGIAFFKDGQLRASYNTTDGLGHGYVSDLQLGSGGAVWAATEGGLSRVKDGRVTTLTSSNGLSCDAVHWVIEDNDHAFWLYQPCGLVRVAGSELDAWGSGSRRLVQTTVFDSFDGVRSRAIAGRYSRKVTKSPDGKIWFAPPDGVSVIDPHQLALNALPPPVRIERIIANHKVYWQNLWGAAPSSLRLPALSRDLQIDYTALSLVAPEKTRLKYKLEGYDREWQDAGSRRQAFYSNLPPRNYTFRVMASNNSGVWNEAGDTLDFSIAPAYYQTAWFRLSLVAAFLALLAALYRYRLHQIAREFNANLEGRVDERLRMARDLHDTLLQSFHGLLMRFQGAHNLLPARPADAQRVLESALDEAAEAITQARDAVQGLRSSAVTTNDLADAVEAMGNELAADQSAAKGNASAFSVDVEGAPRGLHPILRDEVYRIAGEALRNAFNHAHAHRIEVEIRYAARQLRVRVRDDGIGIDGGVLSEEGRSGHWGLRGMRERAKRIGAQLEIWSEQGVGTEIQLSIPGPVAYGADPGRRFRLFSRKVGTSS